MLLWESLGPGGSATSHSRLLRRWPSSPAITPGASEASCSPQCCPLPHSCTPEPSETTTASTCPEDGTWRTGQHTALIHPGVTLSTYLWEGSLSEKERSLGPLQLLSVVFSAWHWEASLMAQAVKNPPAMHKTPV